MIYTIKTEQFLPISSDVAWAFFSSPQNLARITPASLNFKIKSDETDVPIHDGQRIEYTVSPIAGFPMLWVSEIRDLHSPSKFVDIQRIGPYEIWEHTHTFIEDDGGVLVHDSVRYKLPFGLFGRFLHWLFIRRQLKNIFKYRETKLNHLFILNATHDNSD